MRKAVWPVPLSPHFAAMTGCSSVCLCVEKKRAIGRKTLGTFCWRFWIEFIAPLGPLDGRLPDPTGEGVGLGSHSPAADDPDAPE